MGNKRKRRSRRHGYRKPDPIIATLATIAVFLSIVWAALYWNESSSRALTVHADQAEVDNDVSLLPDGEGNSPDSEASSDAPREIDPETGLETNSVPDADTPGTDTDSSADSNSPSNPSSHPDSSSEVEPSSTSDAESTPSSPVESDGNSSNVDQGGGNSDSGYDVPPTDSGQDEPSGSPENTPINKTEKYESDLAEVQSTCTKEMNEVLAGAESGMEQLDRRDLVAVQSWNEQWTKKLKEAEAECDGEFQELIQNAERDSVYNEVIEEWKQTFDSSKEALQADSKAKLARLMGG